MIDKEKEKKYKQQAQDDIREEVENLFYLSNQALNLPLETTTVYNLAYLDQKLEFLEDTKDFFFQEVVYMTDDKKMKIILSNFKEALKTNCNNADFELDKINGNFSYSYSPGKGKTFKERITIKFPKEKNDFKKAILKNFIETITKMYNAICQLLGVNKGLPTDDKFLSEHFLSEWIYYKSTNPKATKEWFINFRIKRLTEKLEQQEKEINFANDEANTPEGYLMEQKKQDYFFLFHYLEYLKKQTIDNPSPQQKASPQSEFKTFDDLFHNKEKILPCIEVLRKVEPPLIDTENRFIGSPKGAICVWYEEMRKQGLVKNADGKTLSKLIPERIENLSISERMFREYHKRAEEKYQLTFKTYFSRIKESK